VEEAVGTMILIMSYLFKKETAEKNKIPIISKRLK
jgi:hypothetical protein